MKSLKKLNALSILACCIFFVSCKKSNPAPIVTVTKNNIVYIYKTDSTDGHAYKTLLEENDCHVTLIDKSKVSATDFTTYHLIVIDDNTDVLHPNPDWTNADTSAIQKSSKPLLLLGWGGLQYAVKIGNAADVLNGAHRDDTRFFVTNKTSTLFTKPFSISIPTSSPAVTLYKEAVTGYGQHAFDGGSIANAELIGRFSVGTTYYPLTYWKESYFTFGFRKGVNDMTSDGKNFMVNLAYYVGKLSL